jgi:23S rRNA (adenine2503-C2)-methyltransferase
MLIPARIWNFEKIAEYGARFYEEGDRKLTLNFALAKNMPVDEEVLVRYFPPDLFLIKITPLNPTYQAEKHKLTTYIDPHGEGVDYEVVQRLRAKGYEVIVSIGEPEESHIGSNCGQYLHRYLSEERELEGGYGYVPQRLDAARS